MPERDDGLFLIDGENILDISPWEWDGVYGDPFTLQAEAKIHEEKGYKGTYFSSNYCYARIGNYAIDEAYFRHYFLFPDKYPFYNYAGIGSMNWSNFTRSDGATLLGLRLQCNNATLKFNEVGYRISSGYQTSALNQIISINEPHWIELHFKKNVTEGAIEVWFDGNIIFQLTEQNIIDSINRFLTGNTYASTFGRETDEYFYIDDGKAAIIGPIGAYSPIPPETIINFNSKMYSKATKESHLYTEIKEDSIL